MLKTLKGVADLNDRKLKKKQLLRNNEYYNMQSVFDDLYSKSKQGYNFTKLVELISTKENILLAYRNIKNNKGSNTVGTDNEDISKYKNMNEEDFVKLIQNKLQNYYPKSVRRVEIPKPNGKKRPLGIPCIDDRIIQQCIKQILEPICEAKFHNHSYGFRPNRGTKHAIARCMHMIHQSNLHFVVDIDIKSFFDNVNHSKLKKQMWHLGIRDKNLICIIGKILKSNIEGIGVPTKGTPQGGIISPLLSNIVLNELEWWISDQLETFKTRHKYSSIGNQQQNLRKSTNLKEMFIVRYADDFKIFCKDYKSAEKIFNAVKDWLKIRLDLEVSDEKSKITNIRKVSTEFLGFKLKAVKKKGRYACKSNMSEKAKKKAFNKIKKQIKVLKYNVNVKEINKYNSIILGIHNYYNCATHITKDMGEINFLASKTLFNRLKLVKSDRKFMSKVYKSLYGEYKGRVISILGIALFPIYGCKTRPPMNFNQNVSNYTEEGRKIIHDKLRSLDYLIEYLLKASYEKGNVELEDNKISLIAGQNGKCFVTGEKLEPLNMECHHKIPKSLGGTDKYENLVWLKYEVHKLIHATLPETIEKYLNTINLNSKGLKKVNSLRKLVGNLPI